MSGAGENLLQSLAAMDGLREKLSACPMVARCGVGEAATIVHALSDIESSCIALLRDLLPKLLASGPSTDETEMCLVDVGEELRHIAYHIHDPRFFRTIEPTHDWITVDYDR